MPSRSNKTEGKGQSGGHCSELGNKWGVGSDLTQRSNKEGRDKGQRCLGERISRPQKPGNVQCQRRRWPISGASHKQDRCYPQAIEGEIVTQRD